MNAAAPATTCIHSDSGCRTLLVLDDCRFHRTLLRRFFTRLGYWVNTTADVAEAITVMRKVRHDVVVLDFDLPGTNGTEVVRALARDAKWPLVIGMCSDGSDTARAAFKAQGVDHFFAKPFDPRAMVSTIRDHELSPA